MINAQLKIKRFGANFAEKNNHEGNGCDAIVKIVLLKVKLFVINVMVING